MLESWYPLRTIRSFSLSFVFPRFGHGIFPSSRWRFPPTSDFSPTLSLQLAFPVWGPFPNKPPSFFAQSPNIASPAFFFVWRFFTHEMSFLVDGCFFQHLPRWSGLSFPSFFPLNFSLRPLFLRFLQHLGKRWTHLPRVFNLSLVPKYRFPHSPQTPPKCKLQSRIFVSPSHLHIVSSLTG